MDRVCAGVVAPTLAFDGEPSPRRIVSADSTSVSSVVVTGWLTVWEVTLLAAAKLTVCGNVVLKSMPGVAVPPVRVTEAELAPLARTYWAPVRVTPTFAVPTPSDGVDVAAA